MFTRRLFTMGASTAAATLLSSCGTILYPDRAHQQERGDLDPAIVILDGIGLFFFLIPGLIAFAVDFATGAIYFPANKAPGDKERTIFDDLSIYEPRPAGRIRRQDIERVVLRHAGIDIDLLHKDVRVARLDRLGQYWETYSRVSTLSA